MGDRILYALPLWWPQGDMDRKKSFLPYATELSALINGAWPDPMSFSAGKLGGGGARVSWGIPERIDILEGREPHVCLESIFTTGLSPGGRIIVLILKSAKETRE